MVDQLVALRINVLIFLGENRFPAEPDLATNDNRQGGIKYYSGLTPESVRNFPDSVSEVLRIF